MSATAHIAHETEGRARIRVPSAKGDVRFFEHVADDLRAYPEVTDVRVNATTASILVTHRGELCDLARRAREGALFDLRDGPPGPRVLHTLRATVLGANGSLLRRTHGAADLRTVAFFVLLGGSAYQLVRGNFIPAGGAMLSQALDLLLQTTNEEAQQTKLTEED